MYDNDLKQKYKNLKSKLFEISNDLLRLNYTSNTINNVVENNISINDKNPIEYSMNTILESVESINETIKNKIIPSINNKL